MCRNDAAGEEVLRGHEAEACSVKRMKPRRCAQGRFFTSSRPGHSPPQEVNTKAASTGVSAVTQQGSPTAELTAGRMKVLCPGATAPGNNFQHRVLAYLGTPS